ncbi:hypothetical protein PMAYCL1PPCAC_19321, partial [Pristionchus mayeri]
RMSEEATKASGDMPAPNEMTSKDYYFDSYAHFGIHEKLLKDKIRTKAYRDAIYLNKHLFKDKVVMDVGSGIGILSMFAAKNGAKRVLAVEFSNMAVQSRQIIKDNNLDHIIEVVQSKIEDIKELPFGIEKVDVIISEWMGYCLFYKSMLNTVLYARDKWLVPRGLLFPDKAKLFVTAIEEKINCMYRCCRWDDVYGFNMSSIRKVAITEPLVDALRSNRVMANSYCVKEVDLYTVQILDLAWASDFTLQMKRDDYVQALVAYFTVQFSKCHKWAGFSTAPDQPSTHWKQTIFYLQDALTVKRGEELKGVFTCAPNARNERELDFKIKVSFHGKACDLEEENTYTMH